MVPPRLPGGELKAEQEEKERKPPLDAAIPGAALPEFVHVDALLKTWKVLPRGRTLQSALGSSKNLYIRRNQTAPDWPEEARRLEGQAEDAKERGDEVELELVGTRRRLNTVIEERPRCREQLQSWAELYALYRGCFPVAPKDRPMLTLKNRKSGAGVPYVGRSGTKSAIPSSGAAPYSHREGTVQ